MWGFYKDTPSVGQSRERVNRFKNGGRVRGSRTEKRGQIVVYWNRKGNITHISGDSLDKRVEGPDEGSMKV